MTAQISLPFECGMLDDSDEVLSSTVNCSPGSSYAANFVNRHCDKLIPDLSTTKTILRTNIIIVQDGSGNGNFDYENNPVHKAFLDDVWTRVNERVNASVGGCTPNFSLDGCNNQNEYFGLNIEFEPHFIELQDNQLYNHRNDPLKRLNSDRNIYVQQINALAATHPDYEKGFNVIATTDKFFDEGWDRSVEIWQDSIWQQGGGTWYYGTAWYSALGGYDNDLTPSFHAPDFYLNYEQQVASNGGIATWPNRRAEVIEYFSGLIIHEYGHYFFDMFHTSACSNNYMQQGGFTTSRDYNQFAAYQVRTLYESLMFRNLGEVVVCAEQTDEPFVIASDESWTADTRIFRDIVIESGAKLEITCTLNMQPDARIYVQRGGELHVNGGTITGCGEYWKGIRVEGFSDFTQHAQSEAGLVRIDNGAIIENARNIISMWNGHIPWPQAEDYYGGLVIAENATFRNSWRAVEFMRYAHSGHTDQSTFTNCTFEDLRIGVSDWESDGVTFDNCAFNRISKQSVLPYNSGINVINGCTFDDTPVGVDIITTSPVLPNSVVVGSSAGEARNEFRCDIYGVRTETRVNEAASQVHIFGNAFPAGSVGVFVQGATNMTIDENIFDNLFTGIVTVETGTEAIRIRKNLIRDGIIGAQCEGDNEGTVFTQNCFDRNTADQIRVPIASSIRSPQSAESDFNTAADNRFLDPSGSSRNSIDNDINNTEIEYVSRTTNQSSEFYPDRSVNTLIVSGNGTASQFNACTDLNPFTGENPDSLVLSYCAPSEVNSGGSPSGPVAVLPTPMSDCRRERSLAYAKQELYAGNKNTAVQYLLASSHFDTRIFGYGIQVSEGNYLAALNILNALNPTTTDETDFVWGQSLYLGYLNTPHNTYALSASDSTTLRNIAETRAPYSGYARSIFQVITEERITATLDEPKSSKSLGADKPSGAIGAKAVSIVPNPSASGAITVSVNDVFSEGNPVEVTVYDLTGRIILTDTFQPSSKGNPINLSASPSGVYIVSFTSSTGERYVEKVSIK